MPEDKLLIRDARAGELGRVAVLMRDAYLEYRENFPPEGWQIYVDNIMDVESRVSDAELIVAEMENRLVGAVTLYPDGSLSSHEGWPEGWAGIRLLAVRPAYRRRGIGRALMEECIRRCRRRGVRKIGLHTAVIMEAARRMYEKMGFVRTPQYDFHPRPETVVMAYSLQL